MPFPGVGPLDEILHHIREISNLLRRYPNTDLPNAPNLAIAGIERTQAVQFFNRPTGQGSGYAPPNSIPLIAGKPTMLRVYVDVEARNAGRPVPTSITGELRIPAANVTIDPVNGPIPARRLDDIDRGRANDTLNFLLPWSVCDGDVDCKLVVFDANATTESVERTFTLRFEAVPPVDVRTVLVHYTGVDFFDKPVDAQPDGWDALEAYDAILRTFPISDFVFDGCDVLPWDRKLADGGNFIGVRIGGSIQAESPSAA
jgi:hypothetical protein